MHLALAILAHLQPMPVVQQVLAAPAIDLEEGDQHLEVAHLWWGVVLGAVVVV